MCNNHLLAVLLLLDVNSRKKKTGLLLLGILIKTNLFCECLVTSSTHMDSLIVVNICLISDMCIYHVDRENMGWNSLHLVHTTMLYTDSIMETMSKPHAYKINTDNPFPKSSQSINISQNPYNL
ncbi:hypothetical protein GDO81_004191 [Engystomops pustulosus]|uniref:Uncharacterized protein n=1 Tax=Engystomops pustulosus TaxID=76066 RepID=A0AAV7A000_ENGPU|nr:hypothetical protein GDO81_004191 [Engystomops pustulosus]